MTAMTVALILREERYIKEKGNAKKRLRVL